MSCAVFHIYNTKLQSSFYGCIEMPIVLRSIGRSSYAFSTLLVSARRVPLPLTKDLQILPAQRVNFLQDVKLTFTRWREQTRFTWSDQKSKNPRKEHVNEEPSKSDDSLAAAKERQARTPWHREGADQAPVSRLRSASAVNKGIILTYSKACEKRAKSMQASF